MNSQLSGDVTFSIERISELQIGTKTIKEKRRQMKRSLSINDNKRRGRREEEEEEEV